MDYAVRGDAGEKVNYMKIYQMEEIMCWVHGHHEVRFHYVPRRRMLMKFEEYEHIT